MTDQQIQTLCAGFRALSIEPSMHKASKSSPLGEFAKLPTEVRIMIWKFYLSTPSSSSTSSATNAGIRGARPPEALSLMRVSSRVYAEVHHVLSRQLTLTFSPGAHAYEPSDRTQPSGMHVSDEIGTLVGFISCKGPIRDSAVSNGARLARKLPFRIARMVRFNVRPVEAGDLGRFLVSWFEVLQMVEFINGCTPKDVPIEVCIFSSERNSDLRELCRPSQIALSNLPDEIEGLIAQTTAGLLMLPFQTLGREGRSKVTLKIVGPQTEKVLKTTQDELDCDWYDINQRLNVITFWLYQRVLDIPGTIANNWRLALFAEWNDRFEEDLVRQLFGHNIDLLDYADPTFLENTVFAVGDLYTMMRAFNPSSVWQRRNTNCNGACCGGQSLLKSADLWSRNAWYMRYPHGIHHQASLQTQLVMARYVDDNLDLDFTKDGITIKNQTHELLDENFGSGITIRYRSHRE